MLRRSELVYAGSRGRPLPGRRRVAAEWGRAGSHRGGSIGSKLHLRFDLDGRSRGRASRRSCGADRDFSRGGQGRPPLLLRQDSADAAAVLQRLQRHVSWRRSAPGHTRVGHELECDHCRRPGRTAVFEPELVVRSPFRHGRCRRFDGSRSAPWPEPDVVPRVGVRQPRHTGELGHGRLPARFRCTGGVWRPAQIRLPIRPGCLLLRSAR